MSIFTAQTLGQSPRWCRNSQLWGDRDLRPCGSRAVGALPEESDNKNPAAVAPLAAAVGLRILRDMALETRKSGTLPEAYGPAQKAQSSESRTQPKSTRTMALRGRANKRTA